MCPRKSGGAVVRRDTSGSKASRIRRRTRRFLNRRRRKRRKKLPFPRSGPTRIPSRSSGSGLFPLSPPVLKRGSPAAPRSGTGSLSPRVPRRSGRCLRTERRLNRAIRARFRRIVPKRPPCRNRPLPLRLSSGKRRSARSRSRVRIPVRRKRRRKSFSVLWRDRACSKSCPTAMAFCVRPTIIT